MKFYLAVISLIFCCGLITAQKCPSICPAVYQPVCGEANVGNQKVRCQFSNPCAMGVSSCQRKINWRSSSCSGLSPNCGKYL